jgi:hypothetical protein
MKKTLVTAALGGGVGGAGIAVHFFIAFLMALACVLASNRLAVLTARRAKTGSRPNS